MPASPNIQIRIVRDNSNSLKDEIFTISKGAHNDWRINHKSPFSQSNSTMYVKTRSDIITYIYTGRRSSEIAALRWGDLEHDASRGRYYYTWLGKGGKGRTDELPPPAWHAHCDSHAASHSARVS